MLLGTRVVAISTSSPKAAAAFEQVSGPVSILLETSDPRVLNEIEALAQRYPVFVTVRYANVTDEGVKLLAGLKLSELSLPDTQVGDGIAETLAGFTELRRLDLEHTQVTGKTVRQLPTSLRVLHLGETHVLGPDAAAVTRLTQLRALNLMWVQFDDSVFAALTQLPELRRFSFNSQNLTDASKSRLLDMPHLSQLMSYGHLDCHALELERVTCGQLW